MMIQNDHSLKCKFLNKLPNKIVKFAAPGPYHWRPDCAMQIVPCTFFLQPAYQSRIKTALNFASLERLATLQFAQRFAEKRIH